MTVNEYDKIESDFRFNYELILHGMVTGTVTVASGGVLILRGMICKDLIVEEGGKALIYGMVVNNVFNRGGYIEIYGMINGTLYTEKGDSIIDSKAVIKG